MKNFTKVYKCIKDIEMDTLYEFKGVNEFDELVFKYDGDSITEEIQISKNTLFMSNGNKRPNELISFNGLILFTELMKALKEMED